MVQLGLPMFAIPTSLVILHAAWLINHWVPPWFLPLISLQRIGRLSWNPLLSHLLLTSSDIVLLSTACLAYFLIIIILYIYMRWGSQGLFELFLFYVNVSGISLQSHLSSQSLTIMAPWVLLHNRWSILLVPSWVTASRFLAGNKESELKPTIFSSLLLFCGFLSFLFWTPSNIVPLSAAC